MTESRKTYAAFVYGNKWLKIAERITKEDGAVSFRNVAEMRPELALIPSTISAEARVEIHARAVGAVGPAPEIAAPQSSAHNTYPHHERLPHARHHPSRP